MPTARYSSIWDRLNGIETSYTQADFDAWVALNYPTSSWDDDRTWEINRTKWAQMTHLWLSTNGGITALQARDAFSLSDHEALQMQDLRDYIVTGSATNQLDRMFIVTGWSTLIEGDHTLVTKAAFYSKFGIRDDVPSG